MTAARPELQLGVVERLPADLLAAARELVAAALAADGSPPLSEHALLHMADGPARAGSGGDEDEGADGTSGHQTRHILAESGDALVGYAILTGPVGGGSVHGGHDEPAQIELAVDPRHRRRRVGAALLDTAAAAVPGQSLALWSHGRGSPGHALATALGFTKWRELDMLARSLRDQLPPIPARTDVALRTYRPGDDAAILAVNAAAFVDLPDQSAWTAVDLAGRMAQLWFDPKGLFIVHPPADPGTVLGFHWTKVHRHADGHDPFGEVYVVAVDPAQRGRGLGRLLTVRGLHHLAGIGLPRAELFVDRANAAAGALYRSLGFTLADTDVQYIRRPPRQGGGRARPGYATMAP